MGSADLTITIDTRGKRHQCRWKADGGNGPWLRLIRNLDRAINAAAAHAIVSESSLATQAAGTVVLPLPYAPYATTMEAAYYLVGGRVGHEFPHELDVTDGPEEKLNLTIAIIVIAATAAYANPAAKALVKDLMACRNLTIELGTLHLAAEKENDVAAAADRWCGPPRPSETPMNRLHAMAGEKLRQLAGPLHRVNEALLWGRPEDEAPLRATLPLRARFEGKGRADLRADRLMPGLFPLLIKILGGLHKARRSRTNEYFALVLRLIGLALKPEYERRAEQAINRFVERTGRRAEFEPADVKALARALMKAVSIDDYRFDSAPSVAMVVDWIRSLVVGTTTADCHELARQLAREFGGILQLKYPPAPWTAAATAAFGVTPLMLTVLVESSTSLADLFAAGSSGATVLAGLKADADSADAQHCPPGIPITQWRRDLKLAEAVLTAPDASRIRPAMAAEFQLLTGDAVQIRALMHMLYKVHRAGLQESLLHLDFQRRGEERPEGGVEQTSDLDDAVRHGWINEIKRLCAAGGITDVDRDWAVYTSADANRLDALVALVDSCPGIDMPARRCPKSGKTGEGPLCRACEKGFHLIARELLRVGADPNRGTPILMASQGGFADTVAMLLHHGADPNRPSTHTPIYAASSNGHAATVKVLLLNDANPNVRCHDEGDWTPIIAASDGGHTAVVRLLLENGADPHCTLTGGTGDTAISMASTNGHTATVKVLLEHGVDPNVVRAEKGESPIYVASHHGHASTIEALVRAGGDVHLATAVNGTAPIITASSQGHTAAMTVLLKHGGNPNACRADNGATPIYLASQNGHTAAIEMLLQSGADINRATTNNGATPIFHLPSSPRVISATPARSSCYSGTVLTPISQRPTRLPRARSLRFSWPR